MGSTWWVDGACSGNPGPGGAAAIELTHEIETNKIFLTHVWSKYEEKTTNNRMELDAILYVIKLAYNDPENVYVVYSDSSYAVNCVNSWMFGWANNGWRNSKNKPVENLDIIKELYNYFTKNLWNFQLFWVKGHSGELGNEIADAIASKNKQKYLTLIKKNNIEEEYYKQI